jgi:hypothetical protein
MTPKANIPTLSIEEMPLCRKIGNDYVRYSLKK